MTLGDYVDKNARRQDFHKKYYYVYCGQKTITFEGTIPFYYINKNLDACEIICAKEEFRSSLDDEGRIVNIDIYRIYVEDIGIDEEN